MNIHKRHDLGEGLSVEFEPTTGDFKVAIGSSSVVIPWDAMNNLCWFVGEVRRWQKENERTP
jgi:hypothetical protein